ncbi:MAG: hypothetical protein HY558_07960, partial [Euryarchaeota archaeon]|nr:hypothetical protein [Euryarchaeota archaeon]
MANTAVHLAVPLLLVLLWGTGRRRALLLLPLSVLPDLDWFLYHRAALHNLWWPLGLTLLVLAPWWVPWLEGRLPERARHRMERAAGRMVEFGKTHREALLVAAFYLASHVFLDYFDDGVVPFWPVERTFFYIRSDLRVEFLVQQIVTITPTGERILTNITTPVPVAEVKSLTFEFTEVTYRAYSRFTSSPEFAVLLLAILGLLLLKPAENAPGFKPGDESAGDFHLPWLVAGRSRRRRRAQHTKT